MLIRRINNIKGQRLRIGAMGVDPHGDYVCLYEQQNCEFLIIEIDSIYKHFQHYRVQYFSNSCYDNKQPLPHLLSFQSEQILQTFPTIQFSIREQFTQCVVIYYCTFIEIIKIHLENAEIITRIIYKLKSEVLETNIVNQNIYVSLYNGSIMRINLHDIDRKKKSEACREIDQKMESRSTKSMSMMESIRLDEESAGGGKVWQSANGNLMLNKKVISNQFEDNYDFQNSFEQYLGKEVNEKHPVKYEMSPCREYIVGSSFGKIVTHKNIFTLKARWCEWTTICTLHLKPEINPYWKSYQSLMACQQNWGFPKSKQNKSKSHTPQKRTYQCDKVLEAHYCTGSNTFTVSWIIINKIARKKVANLNTNCEQNQLQPADSVRYKSQQKMILNVKNLKSSILQMKWIGLNQMLFIDKSFKLHFLEFDEQELRN